MITIRSRDYSKEEMASLHELIDESLNLLRIEYGNCENGDCNNCPVRHVCYDLCLAHDYILKAVSKNKSHKDKR